MAAGKIGYICDIVTVMSVQDSGLLVTYDWLFCLMEAFHITVDVNGVICDKYIEIHCN